MPNSKCETLVVGGRNWSIDDFAGVGEVAASGLVGKLKLRILALGLKVE